MISTQHKFILLHVPKTGGNSIQSILLPMSDDSLTQNAYQDGYDRFDVKGPVTPKKHASFSDYYAILKDEIFDYKITITMRHPLQRALSYYHMPRRWIELNENGVAKNLTPIWNKNDFFKLLEKIKPASDFIKFNDTYIKPDYVIHLENLKADFTQFCLDCGLPFTGADLPHRNKSSYSSNFQPDVNVTQDIIDAVRERFAKDFEMFGCS